jgi:hypothetical protein
MGRERGGAGGKGGGGQVEARRAELVERMLVVRAA